METIVKYTTDKCWWAGNFTDDKPSIECFNNFKNTMIKADIKVNQINRETIEIVFANQDITYLWINHNGFDYYYFYQGYSRVINNGFVLTFKLDTFTTFTLKTINKFKENNPKLEFERVSREIDGYQYLTDELFSSVPYKLDKVVYLKTNLDYQWKRGKLSFINPFNDSYTDYATHSGRVDYYFENEIKLNLSRPTCLYAVFKNDLEENAYIIIPVFLDSFTITPINLNLGPDEYLDNEKWFTNHMTSPYKQEKGVMIWGKEISPNNNVTYYVTPTLFNNGFENGYLNTGTSSQAYTNKITFSGPDNLYLNTYKQIEWLRNNVFLFAGDKFLGYFVGPNFASLNVDLNIYRFSYIKSEVPTFLANMVYFTLRVYDNKPSEGNYPQPNKINGSFKFNIPSDLRKPIIPYLKFKYYNKYLNMIIQNNLSYSIYFVEGFKGFVSNDNARNYISDNILDYGGQYITISDEYKQYILANKQSWDTSLSIAKQQENLGIAGGTLGILSGIGTSALGAMSPMFFGGGHPSVPQMSIGAGLIERGGVSIASSVVNYNAKVAQLKAEKNKNYIQMGTKLNSVIVTDIQQVTIYNDSEYTGQYDLLGYEKPSEDTLNTFNYLLEYYGIYILSWRYFNDIYMNNDFSDKEFFYFKLTTNISNNLSLFIPEKTPTEYWELIYNDLIGGIRLWNQNPQ